MDFPTKHWTAFARRHPSAFPLVNANYIANKNHWVRAAFPTCNFSFVLRGHGELHRFGKIWPVVAPCVLTQWPGEYVEYGPLNSPASTWDELYIIYAAEAKPQFEAAQLIDANRPVWPIRDLAAVRTQASALSQLAQADEPESVVDRVDRVCERLILESWLAPIRRPASKGEAATVQAIMDEMRARIAETALRPETLATRHGWSSSTFRRRWDEVMPESPSRTLQGLRMQAACRMLVESALPVHEIATQSGYSDEFYFSRRFRIEQGMAPREYRRAYLLRRA